MATNAKPFFTPEQYLELEEQAEYKNEYLDGQIFAMAGGTEAHSLIASNIGRDLSLQMRQRPCRVYNSDMQIHVSAAGLYTYPDVSVICGEPKFLNERRRTLLNPTVIVEVLSPSTEAYDRGRKFEYYKTLESLAEYLLVASDHMHADLLTRQPDGRWILASADKPNDAIELTSIACRLVLADIYEKAEF
jgi:Uma2 family endonuclease